jgi:hypothetical protein
MSIFYVLNYAISLTSLNIHNKCQEINLTSPVYFIRGGRWHLVPDQEIDFDAVMQNHIEIDTGQDVLKVVLVYRVQRQHAESAQDESKHIWLLVAWNGEHTKELHSCALLIEHNKKLDKDRLRKLHQKRWSLLKERASATRDGWALNDTTMLTTTIKVTNRGYRWDIFVSEERKLIFDYKKTAIPLCTSQRCPTNAFIHY